jgi:hypothetical protein
MMTGQGPFGSVEMGGMFSVLKVRADQKPGDYSDPGWYQHPQGTIAYEWTGAPLAEPARQGSAGKGAMPRQSKTEVEVQVRKPTQSHQH